MQVQNYENLLNKASWEVTKKWSNSGLDFDEVKSQAYLVFCEAVDRFEEEKGVQFSTFLTWRLKTLNDFAAYNSRRVAYVPDVLIENTEGFYQESTDFQAFCERLELTDAAASLPHDSRVLLNKLLAGEFHKEHMGNKKPSLTSVRKGMKGTGWTAGRVEDAWGELQSWWKYF